MIVTGFGFYVWLRGSQRGDTGKTGSMTRVQVVINQGPELLQKVISRVLVVTQIFASLVVVSVPFQQSGLNDTTLLFGMGTLLILVIQIVFSLYVLVFPAFTTKKLLNWHAFVLIALVPIGLGFTILTLASLLP